MWRSLVARFVRDEEVAGSNPVTPTLRSGAPCSVVNHLAGAPQHLHRGDDPPDPPTRLRRKTIGPRPFGRTRSGAAVIQPEVVGQSWHVVPDLSHGD